MISVPSSISTSSLDPSNGAIDLKTREAGRAFRLTEEYTRYELEKFDFSAPPNWIRVALIGPHGEVRYKEDF